MRKFSLVFGIGDNDGTHCTAVEGKRLKEYGLWKDMLRRCTQNNTVSDRFYTGVTCSENFKSYSFFYEWCNQQKGFNEKDKNSRKWSLDKDLLIRGNKCYSEDVCVFVPNRVNNLVIKRNASRGDWPIGVSLDKATSKYKASCRNGSGTVKTIGMYSSVQEAFRAYKSYKEALIKQVANEYKEQLDSRVYEALMNYEVNEND